MSTARTARGGCTRRLEASCATTWSRPGGLPHRRGWRLRHLLTPAEPGTRVTPRNLRMGMGLGILDDITELFNSTEYAPGETEDVRSPKSRWKLFTYEEKVLLNKRVPDLEAATSVSTLCSE
ncbi:hypothetical protein ABZP36_019138 [Zizania latifolia]